MKSWLIFIVGFFIVQLPIIHEFNIWISFVLLVVGLALIRHAYKEII